jgi:hypothetical protein
MPVSQINNNSLATGVPGRANLPAGSVIQVVNGTYSVGVSTAGTTYVDTGLTATITPTSASNKILVCVHQTGLGTGTGATGVNCNLVRNGTQLLELAAFYMYSTTGSPVGSGTTYLDSPATTSAVTYKTQFKRGTGGSGNVYANDNNSTSTITLMEIAA